MQLTTLERLDPETARAALANAALSLPPSAHGENDAEPSIREASREILSEVRNKLSLADGDLSRESVLRVAQELTRLMTEQIGPGRRAEAAERLGDRGELPPNAYLLNKGKSLVELERAGLIDERLVREAVANPDDVQHLPIPEGENTFFDAITLSVKHLLSRKGSSEAWLLVISVRKGATLTAESGWWVFPDTVDLSTATRPIDVLRAFAVTYGVEQQIGDQTGKFIEWAEGTDALSIAVPSGTTVHSSGFFKGGERSYKYYQLVYSINIQPYKADVIRHGRTSSRRRTS